eukprot:Protomagalhaensia_sp_Gyna_25__1721@NODE_18_length_8108_cov_32_477630_g12_i0_p2_GENE_NODE_18_length_8108_cov_32_477630_g12_i0NODE_18_length_8108_cov_32_477630_g12_i0_p2_ORF_typecomplete_len494_score73_00Asp_protease/PF09668_10/3_7e25RVP_2/PF08284_11/5e10gagasp_proteas/PF13975_6/1_8e04gagasp_proteas/PF13975_6/6_9e07ubiquitin/PF00240_23/9_6e05ubiquitin/PF00240_23/2_9e03UBA/PF00627_31/6_6e05Asp_protease_2/PF13650_6/0_00072UN_NPL4/PF11543_8/0_002Ubiquitin_2/PF14560_6/0_011RVP/PF00077_20/0_027GAPES3/P
MKVGVFTAANRMPTMLEVFPSADIGTFKSMVEVELGIPYMRQIFSVPGKYNEGVIRDQDTLESLGIVEGDMIMVKDTGAPSVNPVASELVERSAKERGFLSKLKQKQPELALAVEKRDLKGITAALTNLFKKPAQAQDPQYSFQPEVATASPAAYYIVQPYYYGAHPNAFADPTFLQGHASLLYVAVAISGVPVKAFLDCSAQGSTMSELCAQMCNLTHAIDARHSGFVGGPGSPKIVGKLHCVPLTVTGGQTFPASLCVMQSMVTADVILGLDFFKRYNCIIDMRHRCLRVGDTASVPFLTSEQVQRSLQDDILRSLLGPPLPGNDRTPAQVNFARDPVLGLAPGAPILPSSNFNFTKSESCFPAAAPPPPSSRQTDRYAPVGQTQAARLTAPAVQKGAPATDPQVKEMRPAGESAVPPRRERPLELNVDRSRRIHQQNFDEKNVGGRQIEDYKIKELTDLGCDPEQARVALRKCKGDTALAAAYLFQSTAL